MTRASADGPPHGDQGACFTVAVRDFCQRCRKFQPMAFTWRSPQKNQARSVSAMLLDFIFGEPRPQPDVAEYSDAQAWQDWLNSMANLEGVIEFEDTLPSAFDGVHAKRPTTGDA